MAPRRIGLVVALFLLSTVLISLQPIAMAQEKIGVIYAVHGGMKYNKPQYMWDAVAHQFSYDQNHSVHKLVIWNSLNWGMVLDRDTTEFARRFLIMYEFGYERMGGFDPYPDITNQHIADLQALLDANPYGIDFLDVEWAGYMAPEEPDHYAYPRFLYTPGPGSIGTDNLTYCGEQEPEDVVLDFTAGTSEFTVGATLWGQQSGALATVDEVSVASGSWGGGDAAGQLSLSGISGSFSDGEIIVDNAAPPGGSATAVGTTHWPDCDPDRYKVDGPAERLLKQGATRIIVIDTTTTGVRFSKTYNVVKLTKMAVADWNTAHGTSIEVDWVNDINNLMERSYPTEPENWTRVLKAPTVDPSVPLAGSPNPWIGDPLLAELFVEGIEAAFSPAVPDNKTALAIFNHSVHDWNEYFDPKIDDTQILNENIKAELLTRRPNMDPDNIIGIFGGIKEHNPDADAEERTRPMRGETYGHAWHYETEKVMPEGLWGLRYWDGLEYLKDRGVEHIVIAFSQMLADNNLNLIELPNQIGKEIGHKTWRHWGTGDYTFYPAVGHPFADYWGNWVDTECDGEPCCFEMGGCSDGRPYPPPRQTPIDEARGDLDPSLGFDVSEYGLLGYDPLVGPPDPYMPVQDQYTGTWDMYRPPNDDHRVAQLLAKYVFQVAYCGNGIIDTDETCGEPGLSCAEGEVCLRNCRCEEDPDFDDIPPDFKQVTTNQGPGGASIPLDNGTIFSDCPQNIIWVAWDPGYPGDGLGWASRMGVAHTYFSYKPASGPIWQPEVETTMNGNGTLGFWGQWSWVYPVDLIGTVGDYDIKLSAEDASGNRSEVIYQITIAAADTDEDGVADCTDNCPTVCNPLQLDADLDDNGDLCDLDPGCGEGCQPDCEDPCPGP